MLKRDFLLQNNIEEIRYQININKKNRLNIFLSHPFNIQALLLISLPKIIQREIMNSLRDNELVSLLNNLDPDDATDMIQLLPKKRSESIVKKLQDELSISVEKLKQFAHDSAGGLMNLDYIQVEIDSNFEDVINKFRKHEKRTGRLPLIIVTENEILKGYLPVHELGLNNRDCAIREFVHRIRTVHADTKQNQILNIFTEHPHDKVAVLGHSGNVVGIIYSDDVLKLIKNRESNSLYHFAGLNKEESVNDSFLVKIKNRYKWLIINLGTAFLAAFTVSLFDETISRYVLLAVYMPIVSGMGGNAGTQTLAVLVRGISLNEIKLKDAIPVLKNEVIAGLFNGIINGIIVGLIVIYINKDFKLAFVLSLAMIINLVVAGFFGTIIPLIMKKLGKDPASSATIFITTATDVLGFIVFLGLATLIL